MPRRVGLPSKEIASTPGARTGFIIFKKTTESSFPSLCITGCFSLAIFVLLLALNGHHPFYYCRKRLFSPLQMRD